MRTSFKILACMLALSAQSVSAAAPIVEQPFPPLVISERGEMTLTGDDVGYRPWSGEIPTDTIQVIQYFAGTNAASETYKPLTDALRETYPSGSYGVTTIVNLDDAMWGTSGIVASTLENNKRKYPDSTFVLDENGDGKKGWELGKKGAGLIIIDPKGIVRYFTRSALSEEELKLAISLVGRYITN